MRGGGWGAAAEVSASLVPANDPTVLFTTAEGDSRVDPMHARKMAALMQRVTANDTDAAVLLRVERDAGHGIGKPLGKQVEDLADQYSFFAWQLGPLPRASAMLGTS